MARPNRDEVHRVAQTLILDTNPQRNIAGYVQLVHALEAIAIGESDTGRIWNRAQYALRVLRDLAAKIPGGGND